MKFTKENILKMVSELKVLRSSHEVVLALCEENSKDPHHDQHSVQTTLNYLKKEIALIDAEIDFEEMMLNNQDFSKLQKLNEVLTQPVKK